jgi:hypothetical protein
MSQLLRGGGNLSNPAGAQRSKLEGVSPLTGGFPPHLTSCLKVRNQTQQPGDG